MDTASVLGGGPGDLCIVLLQKAISISILIIIHLI